MARARNIKPSFFQNEQLADAGPLAMLLFAGLWTLADREGRLEDRPRRIKAQVFPYFDVNVDAELDALQGQGFILRYIANDQRYIQILTFHKHQTPHIKEAASTIPAPDKHQTDTVLAPPLTLNLIPDTGLSDCGVQGSADADAPPVVKSKPRRRIPDSWVVTDELRAYAIEHGIPAAQVDEFAAEFKRYWQGDGRPKADWDLTFMGRVRDQAGRYQARASPNGSNGTHPDADPDMAAWLQVVKDKEHEARTGQLPETPTTRAIHYAVKAIGGWAKVDPTNGYQRRDFLAAHKAARQEVRHEATV